jgi:SAM-dependent methyltransferase
MIEQAQALNKSPATVRYHLNVRTDLSAFPEKSYDFIYSNICLQHIPTRYQLNYIADFMRLLKPGGIAYFQTIHARGWRQWVPHAVADMIRKLKNQGKAFIPMYGTPVCSVRQAIEKGGGLLKVNSITAYEGWEARYVNDFYIVEKQGAGTP